MEIVSYLIIAIILFAILLPLLLDWYATLCLVGAILAIFLIQWFFEGWGELGLWANDLPFSPHNFGAYQLITSIFLHGDILHMMSNLIPLMFIGLSLEDRMGGRRVMSIYLLSGLTGNLAFLAINWGTYSWALGASGAVLGIIGALAFLYPRDKIIAPIGIFIVPLPAALFAIFMGCVVLTQITMASEGIAHEAHIFGIAGGIVFAALFRRIWKIDKVSKSKYKLDTKSIEPFLKGKRENEIYERIRDETGEIRDAWIEHLLPKLICPVCGGRPKIVGERLECRCGYGKDKNEENST